MEKSTIIRHVFVMSLFIVIASWSISLANATEQPVKETTPRPPTADLNSVAANSIDDTLKACLTRTPEAATAGQRLLAEQNCRGEERSRQEAQTTPRF